MPLFLCKEPEFACPGFDGANGAEFVCGWALVVLTNVYFALTCLKTT